CCLGRSPVPPGSQLLGLGEPRVRSARRTGGGVVPFPWRRSMPIPRRRVVVMTRTGSAKRVLRGLRVFSTRSAVRVVMCSALLTLFVPALAGTASAATATDLGTLGGTGSDATAVNAGGQVVGRAYTAGNAA